MQEASQRRDPFYGIADANRRKILSLLSESDLSISEIAINFRISRSGVRKHLSILEGTGLVKMSRKGRETVYSLQPEPLRAVVDWIKYFESFWDERLEALKECIESDED